MIEIAGPWQHRYVAANGARFHLAEAEPARTNAPMVLFLHGFPQFWWSWRAQLPALASAGYRAVAMDLRGYGGSDKPPRGYDPLTLAADVAGVIKALGHRSAVVVGQGWGGYVGWAAAALHPQEVSALCAVSAPHPRVMLRALPLAADTTALRHIAAMQVPLLPERRLADPRSGFLTSHLEAWSGSASPFPDAAAIATYQSALTVWPAPHCALEYHRWLFRSRLRADGRHFARRMRPPLHQPVCMVHGDQDRVVPASVIAASKAKVDGLFQSVRITGAGHFPPEEQPAAFNERLLEWLEDVVGPISQRPS